MNVRTGIIAALAAGAVVLAGTSGCTVTTTRTSGNIIPAANMNTAVSEALTKSVGRAPDNVDCPDAPAKVGGKTRCTLTDGGQRYGLTATVRAVSWPSFDLSVQVDNKPQP